MTESEGLAMTIKRNPPLNRRPMICPKKPKGLSQLGRRRTPAPASLLDRLNSYHRSVKQNIFDMAGADSYNSKSLGISLAVGRLTLDQLGQVRILDPQPVSIQTSSRRRVLSVLHRQSQKAVSEYHRPSLHWEYPGLNELLLSTFFLPAHIYPLRTLAHRC
jgi:hypothetical protein